MLHVILTILKILGILILVILGIILTVLLLVLLVPIRYGADAYLYGKPKGNISVSWLMRFISVRVSYDGKVHALVKLFFFRVFDKDVWPAEEEAEEEDAFDSLMEDATEPLIIESEKEQPVKHVPESKQAIHEKVSSEPKKANPKTADKQKTNHQSQMSAQTKDDEAEPIKITLIEKIQKAIEKIISKIQEMIRTLSRKKEEIINKVHQAKCFLNDPNNQKTFKLIVRQIGRLLKHILPRRISGRAKFGFDDPYTTGQILTYISPFYGMYAKTFTIEPVFDESIKEGEIHLKGRIRLGSLLWITARVFFDKNFRMLLKRLLAKKK